MSIILYALNRFIKLYYYVQRIAQSIKVEFKAYMFFKWEKMKTVWIHLKDTLVNFDECASKSREKYKIYPSKIKDLLCCEEEYQQQITEEKLTVTLCISLRLLGIYFGDLGVELGVVGPTGARSMVDARYVTNIILWPSIGS
jgi:hypothetical protein